MRLFKPNVKKMSQRGDVNGLVKALEDKDKSIVEEATHSLCQIGGEREIKAIVARLNDKSPFPKHIKKGYPGAKELFECYTQILVACAGEQNTASLVEGLKTAKSIDVQHCCIHALTKLKATDLLLDQLKTNDSYRAEQCYIQAFGELKTKNVLDTLCDMAANDLTKKGKVGLIANTLASAGVTNSRIENTLIAIFDAYPTMDLSSGTRAAIVIDLSKKLGEKVRKSVTNVFSEHSVGYDPTEESIKALGQLGGRVAHERLSQELQDSSNKRG